MTKTSLLKNPYESFPLSQHHALIKHVKSWCQPHRHAEWKTQSKSIFYCAMKWKHITLTNSCLIINLIDGFIQCVLMLKSVTKGNKQMWVTETFRESYFLCLWWIAFTPSCNRLLPATWLEGRGAREPKEKDRRRSCPEDRQEHEEGGIGSEMRAVATCK